MGATGGGPGDRGPVDPLISASAIEEANLYLDATLRGEHDPRVAT
jgi:hypothetical protein